MKSAITVSLVKQARGGPFVYWDGVEDAAEKASALGFDAIEIFPPNADVLDAGTINALVKKHKLSVAAIGTGGGWVIHKTHLCLPSERDRAGAREFIGYIIDKAAELNAPAIIGSMQGKWGEGVSREHALEWLAQGLTELGERAAAKGQALLYEPLNRYETNLFNTVSDTVAFLETLPTRNIRILADLFHMNIEEADVAGALRAGGNYIGHIHFVDSNRRAVGMGHTDFVPIVSALKEINYAGYLSAEAFPLPDTDACAKQQITGYNQFVKGA